MILPPAYNVILGRILCLHRCGVVMHVYFGVGGCRLQPLLGMQAWVISGFVWCVLLRWDGIERDGPARGMRTLCLHSEKGSMDFMLFMRRVIVITVSLR